MKGGENFLGNRRIVGERMSSEDIEITIRMVKWMPPREVADMMVPGPVGGGRRMIGGTTEQASELKMFASVVSSMRAFHLSLSLMFLNPPLSISLMLFLNCAVLAESRIHHLRADSDLEFEKRSAHCLVLEFHRVAMFSV